MNGNNKRNKGYETCFVTFIGNTLLPKNSMIFHTEFRPIKLPPLHPLTKMGSKRDSITHRRVWKVSVLVLEARLWQSIRWRNVGAQHLDWKLLGERLLRSWWRTRWLPQGETMAVQKGNHGGPTGKLWWSQGGPAPRQGNQKSFEFLMSFFHRGVSKTLHRGQSSLL